MSTTPAPGGDPLARYSEPHRTRIRAQARRLAEVLADAHSGYGLQQQGLTTDDVERAILEQCAPSVRFGHAAPRGTVHTHEHRHPSTRAADRLRDGWGLPPETSVTVSAVHSHTHEHASLVDDRAPHDDHQH